MSVIYSCPCNEHPAYKQPLCDKQPLPSNVSLQQKVTPINTHPMGLLIIRLLYQSVNHQPSAQLNDQIPN